MKRESVNPWDWGLQFSMDQGKIVEGTIGIDVVIQALLGLPLHLRRLSPVHRTHVAAANGPLPTLLS